MYHSIAHVTSGVDSAMHFKIYQCDGACEGVTSFAPWGFNGLLLHSSCEHRMSSSVVPCPNGMNVPVVILSNLPGLSNVDSFGLISQSRLSYPSAFSPSFNK